MYAHEDDEWRYAVRDLSEVERNNTGIEVRTSVGLCAYDGEDE